MRRAGRKIALGLYGGQSHSQLLSDSRFRGRDFSDATISALVDAGIDAPERLLFMSAADLKKIKGIGPVKRKEIDTYRAKYLAAEKL